MAEPSFKSPAMEDSLREAFGFDRRKYIRDDKCICGSDAKEFRDEVSRREYMISGLCQKCQDKVFKDDNL